MQWISNRHLHPFALDFALSAWDSLIFNPIFCRSCFRFDPSHFAKDEIDCAFSKCRTSRIVREGLTDSVKCQIAQSFGRKFCYIFQRAKSRAKELGV